MQGVVTTRRGPRKRGPGAKQRLFKRLPGCSKCDQRTCREEQRSRERGKAQPDKRRTNMNTQIPRPRKQHMNNMKSMRPTIPDVRKKLASPNPNPSETTMNTSHTCTRDSWKKRAPEIPASNKRRAHSSGADGLHNASQSY